MAGIEVVSFDMECTLIDDSYSNLIWETDIPRLYGEKHGLDMEEARARVLVEYAKVGEDRPEWYDIDYWFKRLGLDDDWRELLKQREGACCVYSEVPRVLERMSGEYTLIVSSNTIREFLEVQLTKLPDVFTKSGSARSTLTGRGGHLESTLCVISMSSRRSSVSSDKGSRRDLEDGLEIHSSYYKRLLCIGD
jgi:hypothetical protein